MLANFFSLDGRNYLNNAVVIAHSLKVIQNTFGDVSDFNIKFKKPFNTQGEFTISTNPLGGHTVGSFVTGHHVMNFCYVPTNIELTNHITDPTYFDILYEINNMNRDAVEVAYISEFGSMNSADKAIFVKGYIPVTSVINSLVDRPDKPDVVINNVIHLGNHRFKTDVYLNDKFFGNRYTTIKEFIV
jgi:hypothetical protein